MSGQKHLFLGLTLVSAMLLNQSVEAQEVLPPPQVGESAPGFELKSLKDGKRVSLKENLEKGPVVLVVLRGYPEYQCPICNIQVARLIRNREKFDELKAQVILVYPGEGKNLKKYAQEFFGERSFPENFTVVTDPDYTFTNIYALRWNKQRETAYPSTFVIDQTGKITFAQISTTHAGRAKIEDINQALESL